MAGSSLMISVGMGYLVATVFTILCLYLKMPERALKKLIADFVKTRWKMNARHGKADEELPVSPPKPNP